MLTERNNQQRLECPDLLRGQRVLVVGLGITGLSCVRFLERRGVEVAACDTRLEPPGLSTLREEYPQVPVFVGGLDAQAFERAEVIVVSPGVPIATPLIDQARERGKPVVGDIELLANCSHPALISITGSNGKSTVTTLVGEMLRIAGRAAYVGGNIGVPALDLLDAHPDAALLVLELSSFQLETTRSLQSMASVILNISEDHMDRYASLQDYAQAKAVVYQNAEVCVANADDPRVMGMVTSRADCANTLRFTLRAPQSEKEFGLRDKDGTTWLAQGEHGLLPVTQLRIQGRHNIANALAALALGTAVNIPTPAMLEALRNFTGLPHRSQWIAESNGVTWINDSKATNVGAAVAAIEGIAANKLVVILGGQGKGQDFTPLNPPLQARARHVLLLGEDAALIEQALSVQIPQTRVKDMAEAVQTAKRIAQSGDAVLLSPACASFDMYRDYQARGDAFGRLVREQLS